MQPNLGKDRFMPRDLSVFKEKYGCAERNIIWQILFGVPLSSLCWIECNRTIKSSSWKFYLIFNFVRCHFNMPILFNFFQLQFFRQDTIFMNKREMINRRLSLFSKHARVKLAQIVNILFNLFEKTRTRRSKSVPLVFLNWLFLCQREITGNICQWVKKRTKYFEDLYYLTSTAYIPIPA